VNLRNLPLIAASVLAVAAAACAGWFGWSWYSAAHSPAAATARARDVALQDAEQAVLNFNTLDYHQASGRRFSSCRARRRSRGRRSWTAR
jgi:Mce-associated membrane protein